MRGPKTAALRGGAWECRDKGWAGKGGVMLPGSLPFGTLTGLTPHTATTTSAVPPQFQEADVVVA